MSIDSFSFLIFDLYSDSAEIIVERDLVSTDGCANCIAEMLLEAIAAGIVGAKNGFSIGATDPTNWVKGLICTALTAGVATSPAKPAKE